MLKSLISQFYDELMKKLILLLILLSLGCAKDEEQPVPEESIRKKLESLVDESSPEERALLAENMELINSYASEFAQQLDFRTVPILVTTKKDIIKSGNGLCLYEGKKGLKIYLRKDFFTPNLFEKETGFAPPIYNLLVHEIGHCYLLRKHEQTYLSKPGHQAKFKIEGKQPSEFSYHAIPASMMADDFGFRIPKQLEKYYVWEIFGKFRAKTLEELQEKYPFEIVPE